MRRVFGGGWCGEWLCLEFLEVVNVLQNYDV